MTNITHYNSRRQYDERCTNQILYTNDLVTYSFDGDYVEVLKSRYSKTGTISFAKYLELATYTLSASLKAYNTGNDNKPKET